MKNINTYDDFINEKFGDKIRSKIKNISIKGLYKNTVDFSKNVWGVTKREGKETKMAIQILRKMIKGMKVSDKEKLFLKKQSLDIMKLLPLVAIQGIPGGSVAITPLLIALGKKYNFDIIPKSNQKYLD
jgi:hypothetical protein